MPDSNDNFVSEILCIIENQLACQYRILFNSSTTNNFEKPGSYTRSCRFISSWSEILEKLETWKCHVSGLVSRKMQSDETVVHHLFNVQALQTFVINSCLASRLDPDINQGHLENLFGYDEWGWVADNFKMFDILLH